MLVYQTEHQKEFIYKESDKRWVFYDYEILWLVVSEGCCFLRREDGVFVTLEKKIRKEKLNHFHIFELPTIHLI